MINESGQSMVETAIITTLLVIGMLALCNSFNRLIEKLTLTTIKVVALPIP
jgi:hypothetical protein